MNEHPLPPDESASAFLDDEIDDAEAAKVRDDPAAAARAEALRLAAEAVGEAVSPPPGAEDAAVAAALADFDARRVASLDTARRRPRGLRVITSVAAAVAIGFIVAAAVGLFAEREGADSDTVSMAAAPAPPPSPEPAPADEASAAAVEIPPPAEPAPPPADEQCVAALGGRTVALRLPVDGNHILVVETPDGELAALDGTTCAEIPPDDPAQMTTDPSPALCAETRGVEIDLQITVAEDRIVVLRTSGGELTALDGTTCAPIQP